MAAAWTVFFASAFDLTVLVGRNFAALEVAESVAAVPLGFFRRVFA
jgi:hypothetical protein